MNRTKLLLISIIALFLTSCTTSLQEWHRMAADGDFKLHIAKFDAPPQLVSPGFTYVWVELCQDQPKRKARCSADNHTAFPPSLVQQFFHGVSTLGGAALIGDGLKGSGDNISVSGGSASAKAKAKAKSSSKSGGKKYHGNHN